MERRERVKRTIKREGKVTKIEITRINEIERKIMEGKVKRTVEMQGNWRKGEKQIQIYLWRTRTRYRKIESIYKAAGWEPEKIDEEESAEHLR